MHIKLGLDIVRCGKTGELFLAKPKGYWRIADEVTFNFFFGSLGEEKWKTLPEIQEATVLGELKVSPKP